MCALFVLLAVAPAQGQAVDPQDGKPSAGAAANRGDDPLTAIDRELTNPASTTTNFNLRTTTYWLSAVEFRTQRVEQTIEVEPLFPFQLTDSLWLLTKPKISLLDSKPYDNNGEIDRSIGVGDLQVPLILVPSAEHWLFGTGPTFVLPTATSDQLGDGKWQVGPAAVVGYRSSRWLAAVFAQQWWSFAGSMFRKDVSKFNAQYFLSYFLDDGWSIGMSPTIQVNWKDAKSQQLTLPVGLGVGKVLKFGDRIALKLGVEMDYMVIRPDNFGQRMSLQFKLTPVLPELHHGPIFGGS
ncbi:MAG TPA: hypothetical protein VK714_20890 [Myxococcota bacterium]|nr:hypothetical protein [Myxococcota bacterium]